MTAVLAPPRTRVLTRGPQVARWVETHCRHTKGRWYGKPFVLLPWQRDLLNRLYAEDSAGMRRYREAYVRIPKKNGKTELAAALALFSAVADREPAPEVYCAANSDEQADLVFGAARTMCELSPTLKQVSECFAKEIHVKRADGTLGKIRRLSATVGTNDGLNVSHAIFDELHEFTATKGEAMYTVVTNGTAARLEPLILEISTAGYDPESLEYRKYQYGLKVNSGEIDDPSFLFVNYEAPEGADYRDLAAWAIANPSWGTTILPAYAEQQLRSKPEGVVRRYNLNQQTEVESLWLPAGAWDACRVDALHFDPALPVVAAWDAARSRDSTAVVLAQRQGERVLMRATIWERPLNPANAQPLEGWVTPTGEVMAHLRGLAETFGLPNLIAVGYDPWGIKESVETLRGEGIPMLEVPQTNARMIPATEYLYELITGGVIAHDGDATFARHMRNVVARTVPNGVRMDKMRNRRPMDAAIAAAICAYLLMSVPDEPVVVKAPNLF